MLDTDKQLYFPNYLAHTPCELATANRKNVLFISPHHHPINDQIELLSASLIMIK